MGFFQNSEQVQQYLSSGKSALTGTKEEYNKIVNAEFFDSRVDELESLRDILISSEQAFFKRLGIDISDMSAALNKLQEKIDNWNGAGATNMIMGNNTNLILDILKLYEGVPLEELVDAFQNRAVLVEIFGEEFAEEFETSGLPIDLAPFFNSANIQAYTQGSKFSPKKLNKYIKFTQDETLGKYSIEFSEDITSGYKNRLADLFNTIAKEKGLEVKKLEAYNQYKDIKKFQQQIYEKVSHYVQEPALKYISEELMTNFSEYALTKTIGSFVVTRGFLGEVYWNAFFKYLGLQSIPTGTVKDLEKHRSITIDMIFEEFGFQIKAYTLKNGQVEFGTHGETRQVGNFIEDRAQIPMPTSQALEFFFGAWAYNQPIANANPSYISLYNEISSTVGDVDRVFQMYADRIIGLDKTFEVEIDNKIPFFSEGKQLYFNTFFLIGDKPVPGSSIIQAIIDSFRKEEVKIKFKGDYFHDKKPVWPDKPFPSSALQAANKATISYSILINVEEILNSIYSYIQ